MYARPLYNPPYHDSQEKNKAKLDSEKLVVGCEEAMLFPDDS